MNYKNSLVLNFDSLKEIICKYGSKHDRKDKKSKKNKNVNNLKIVNECKITREKWTRRIVNKREEKEYQVVFDKRIVLDKGQDSIPYGYYWSPSSTSTIKPPFIPSVPDNLLYTLINPSDTVGEQSTRAELMKYNDPIVENDSEFMEIERDIDLMDTDGESDSDFESEHDSDIEFMNDNELSDEAELSFYRLFDNMF